MLKLKKFELNNDLAVKRKNRHNIAYHIYCIHRNKQDKSPLKSLHELRNDLDKEIKDIETQLAMIMIQLNTVECKINEFHICMTIALTRMVNDVNFDNMLIMNGQPACRNTISCQPVSRVTMIC